VNGRQEERLENIERLLTDIRDVLFLLRPPAVRPLPRQSGLNDLTRASNERSAELERDRREAERANGWAPDSELSYRDQYERLSREVATYDRLVDEANATADDPRPSSRLPWNQEQKSDRERIRTVPQTQDRRYDRTDPRRRPREGDVP
jgi:hypothetical protein